MSETTEASQYQEVMRWLESKYKVKNQIPPFEINSDTIKYLYELKKKNETRNKQTKVLMAREYKMEGSLRF